MNRTILRRVGGTSGQSVSGAPDEFFGLAWRRLGHTALIYAAAYLANVIVGRIAATDLPLFYVGDAVALLVLSGAVAFARFSYARAPTETSSVLVAGMLFQIAGSAGIEVGALVHTPDLTGYIVPGLSWVAVWIAMFPVIVPLKKWQVFVAGMVSASFRPLLILMWFVQGVELPGADILILLTVPNYFCVAVALFGSSEIYRVGHQAREARELGAYKLVERIGEGGMGEVWRAEHRMLARPAAIKLVKSSTSVVDSQTLDLYRRFEREALATASLTSPNTVRIYDFGITQDRAFYYVMEQLHGLDLEQLVTAHGPLRPERAVHLLKQICASLGEAHEEGLIHRDIKPANIFVAHVGLDYDFVKVVDFGLVKFRESEDAWVSDDEIAGTPAYMAPEMLVGGVEVDARADIYALGCVAYWMLTGRHVFEADDPVSMAAAHLEQDPTPLLLATELDVPQELDELVMHCLAKAPERRPESVDVVLTRLETLGFEVVWDSEHAQSWWSRHAPEAVKAIHTGHTGEVGG